MRLVDTNFTMVIKIISYGHFTRPKKAQMPLASEVYKSTGDTPIHVCGKIPFVSFGKI